MQLESGKGREKKKKILDDHYWIAARNRIENASFAKKLIPYEAIKLVLEWVKTQEDKS